MTNNMGENIMKQPLTVTKTERDFLIFFMYFFGFIQAAHLGYFIILLLFFGLISLIIVFLTIKLDIFFPGLKKKKIKP